MDRGGPVRKTATLLFAAAVMGMGGCGGEEEPAAPPTSERALTSATPTTEAPTEDTSPTTEDVKPTTEAPTTEAAEKFDQSEEGAEAFARHYIDLINSTGTNPKKGVLEPLATDECDTCENYAGNVKYLLENGLRNSGDAVEIVSSEPTLLGDDAVVMLSVKQLAIDVVDDDGGVDRSYEASTGTMKVDLLRAEDEWFVSGIFVSED
jgi:hypothetical protein